MNTFEYSLVVGPGISETWGLNEGSAEGAAKFYCAMDKYVVRPGGERRPHVCEGRESRLVAHGQHKEQPRRPTQVMSPVPFGWHMVSATFGACSTECCGVKFTAL